MSISGFGFPAASWVSATAIQIWRVPGVGTTLSIARTISQWSPRPLTDTVATGSVSPGGASPAPVAAPASPTASPVDTLRLDYASLFTAVQAGDLETAAKALDSIAADRAALGLADGYGRHHHGRIMRDFGALANAITAGDVTAAQSALQKLLDDVAARLRRHEDDHDHDHEEQEHAPVVVGPGAPVVTPMPAQHVPIGANSPSTSAS